jgi:hypothetical protein
MSDVRPECAPKRASVGRFRIYEFTPSHRVAVTIAIDIRSAGKAGHGEARLIQLLPLNALYAFDHGHDRCRRRTDMLVLWSDVRYRAQSRKPLLAASISPFDGLRTYRNRKST